MVAFMLFPPSSSERTQESALTVVHIESLYLKFILKKVLVFLSLRTGDSPYYREFCGRVGCWEEYFARSCTLYTSRYGDSHALELTYIYKACGVKSLLKNFIFMTLPTSPLEQTRGRQNGVRNSSINETYGP